MPFGWFGKKKVEPEPAATTTDAAAPDPTATENPNSAAPTPTPTTPTATSKPQAASERQAQHSKELILAFRPIQYFLTIIGQMPFIVRPKKDGTYTFKFYKFSMEVAVYMFAFIISTALYLTVTLGILSFIAASMFKYIQPQYQVTVQDGNEEPQLTLWERYLVRREMVSMIVVWSWQTVAFSGSLYIVMNSKYYVHYMNYFNRVVQIMDMDMTSGVTTYLLFNNILSLAVAILLTIGFVAGLTTSFTAVTNTSLVISNFILRLFNFEISKSPDQLPWFKVMGYVVMLYALFASRANIVQFLFFSQLLKNGSRVWNERLRKVLTHEEIPADQARDQFSRRLEPKLVYKDHLMIVQLFQMTENVFGTILFAYYSLTLISVVMELYQLAALRGFETQQGTSEADNSNSNSTEREILLITRRGISNEVDEAKEDEVLATAGVCILLLAQNVFFCYRTTVDAAKAYETAMKGFDTLRRHGLMYSKNKTDRNFVLSLYFSFAKNNPLQLSAGGYFAINKVLLVVLCSAIFNWAISIYQTRVDQWK